MTHEQFYSMLAESRETSDFLKNNAIDTAHHDK
jgi:hypothetical protein